MAKKKKTVEQLSKEFHERERLAYEKRNQPSEVELEVEQDSDEDDTDETEAGDAGNNQQGE